MSELSGKKGSYRWSVIGLPFMPTGVVFNKENTPIVRLEYEQQNEKLFFKRLAAITRAMDSVDRSMP